jgi:hypothetical protein
VTQHKPVLAVISLVIMMAGSGAAQQASSTPETTLPNENCAGCFAYLEFAPSLEPESYAMRGQAKPRPPSRCLPQSSPTAASGS